ncbi:MAG TPA: hypothetical protein VGE53_03265 [Candidatus Paceibacterota bacterium]
MSDKGQNKDQNSLRASRNDADNSDFVLEKVIFSNVFEKDIRRVYLYKKAERLAKAIHLIVPAFTDAPSFKDRLDRIAVGLVDAAVLPPAASREALSRELLALSSMLGIARTGGKLTPMNADLIAREAHLLLAEVAGYEEPRLTLEEVPTLASLAKAAAANGESARLRSLARVSYDAALDTPEESVSDKGQSKGHIKDTTIPKPKAATAGSQRREGILSVLRTKGPSYIKDISLVVRDVSEKTIQRELSVLVSEGVVKRKGDRRWTTYELA